MLSTANMHDDFKCLGICAYADTMTGSDGTQQDMIKAIMALGFSNNHIIYYHMDAEWSTGLGWTYFPSPDYLAVKCLFHSMFFHLDTINPQG